MLLRALFLLVDFAVASSVFHCIFSIVGFHSIRYMMFCCCCCCCGLLFISQFLQLIQFLSTFFFFSFYFNRRSVRLLLIFSVKLFNQYSIQNVEVVDVLMAGQRRIECG